jgi:single-stranded-DNA-specific exonuclease
MIHGARWSIPQVEEDDARGLAEALNMHRPVARALIRRGYGEPGAARRFLEAPLDDLHDPFLMQGMSTAAARLVEAIRRGEPILLYGDYDVDGTTSVVVLKRAIELAGGQVSFHIPNRLREGYGMRPEVVEQAAAAGVKLLISVDTGIRAAEVIRGAGALGIDVIVTDHHLPEAELPPAVAVLNPKRSDCAYPEKNLCGVGVVFKLADALLRTVGWTPARRRRVLGSLLKLVAIGTVADVVPLTGENRILVKHGLEGLRSVRNPGLRALLDVAGITEGDAPTAAQVAFRVAPRMNAAGRMADAGDVIDLFLTEDPERARELAGRLHLWNQERQEAEAEMLRNILEECSRVPVTSGDKALVFSGPGWHRGVVGIVASRLVERFHRPAVVLGEDPETGLAHGSGRGIPAFHLLEALESMPELFTTFGGHRQAAGVTLPSGRIADFRKRLNEYACARLADEDLVPVLEMDGVVELSEIDDGSVAEILALAPFGCENPPPVFAILDAELAGPPKVLKEKHLRLSLRQSGSATLHLVAWNAAERAQDLRSGARIDAAVCFEDDPQSRKRGYRGWSAVLKDFRAAARPAREGWDRG